MEQGTALLFRVRLRRPPQVPDPRGRPFRIDVVLRDPALPAYSVGPYRRVNRIIRYDAVEEQRTRLLLLAEGTENVFHVVGFAGRTLTMPVPGRLLVPDEDLGGLDLGSLRWSVVARDGGTCDVLRDGIPRFRLRPHREAAPGLDLPADASGGTPAEDRAERTPGALPRSLLVAAIGAVGMGLAALLARRR